MGILDYCARNSNFDAKSCNINVSANNHYDYVCVFYFNKTLCGQIKPLCVLKPGCDHQLGILDLKLSGRCDGKIGGQKSMMFI